jgi:hypothetical protein
MMNNLDVAGIFFLGSMGLIILLILGLMCFGLHSGLR